MTFKEELFLAFCFVFAMLFWPVAISAVLALSFAVPFTIIFAIVFMLEVAVFGYGFLNMKMQAAIEKGNYREKFIHSRGK